MDDPEAGMRPYDGLVTTALDVAALLLVAFAVGALLFPVAGWPATGASGLVLFGGARLSEWMRRRSP